MRLPATLLLLATLSLVLSCAGGAADEGAKSAGNGKAGGSGSGAASGDDDEDLSSSTAVPMALIDGEFLAQINLGTGPAAIGGGLEPRAEPKEAGDASDQAFALAVVNTGGRAIGEIQKIYDEIRSTQDELFGAQGFFRGQDVKMRKDGKPRVFDASPAGAPASRYVVANANAGAAEYQFSVEVFSRRGDGSFARELLVDFTPRGEGTGSQAKVRLQRAPLEASSETQHLIASYDTEQLTVTGTYGRAKAVPERPSRTTIAMTLEGEASYTAAGAYTWERPAPQLEGIVPRHHATQTGDVELFAIRGRIAGAAPAAQKLAFLPVELAAGLDQTASASYFDTFGYPRSMLEYLRRLVRDPGINVECATSGTRIRAALAGQENLPDDVCASNAAVADAAIEGAIDAACTAKVDLILELVVDGTAQSYSLCRRHFETTILANPQLLYTDGGKRVLVQAPDPALPEHAVLASELAPIASVDFKVLRETTWPQSVTRVISDFAGSEASP